MLPHTSWLDSCPDVQFGCNYNLDVLDTSEELNSSSSGIQFDYNIIPAPVYVIQPQVQYKQQHYSARTDL